MKTIKFHFLTIVVLMLATNISFAQIPASTDSTKTITIKVQGITCSLDIKTIASNVEKLTGVNSCIASKNGTTTLFTVKYNTDKLTVKEIYTSIENTAGCKNPNDKPYKVKQ